MAKNRLFYTFSLIISFVFILLAYQNCGEVGGTSPFDYNSTDPGDEGNQSYNQLSINNVEASINDRILDFSGSCNVYDPYDDPLPFWGSGHRIQWQLLEGSTPRAGSMPSSGGNYNSSDFVHTGCNSNGRFSLSSQDIGFSSSNTQSYSLVVELVPIVNGSDINDGIVSSNNPITTNSWHYPSTTEVYSEDYASWYTNGNYREIKILDFVGASWQPYTGMAFKVSFDLNSSINTRGGSGNSEFTPFLEFLPYGSDGPKYKVFIWNQVYSGSQYHCIAIDKDDMRNCVNTNEGVNPFFEPGRKYTFYMNAINNGNVKFKFKKMSDGSEIVINPSSTPWVGIFNSSYQGAAFGLDEISIRLGITNPTTYYPSFSGFSNPQLDYRICGYTAESPSAWDYDCREQYLQ